MILLLSKCFIQVKMERKFQCLLSIKKGWRNPEKILLYYNTLKFLRRKQIAYRLWYFLRQRYRRITHFQYVFKEYPSLAEKIENSYLNSIKFKLDPSIAAYSSFSKENDFTFLNLNKKFDNEIDWEFGDYGKLWTYNLTYFDFLNQNETETDKGDCIKIIEDFIQKQTKIKIGNEPFPISLRGINWIKFLRRCLSILS